jgi:outer membrane protein assembly factor BamB
MYLSYHGGSKEGRSGTVIEARESGNGARAWNSGISEDPISAKLLLGNTVIIGTRGSSPVVRAVDGTAGEACWEVSLDEPNTEITGLAFCDGRIYVTSAGIAGDTLDTGYCIALEPETGKRRWITKFSQPVHDVSVSEQGPLVRTSNSVCSLDSASGTELWHRAAGGGAREAPVVKNGTVFVGENHKLSARDLNDGELLWSTRISSNVVRVRAGTQSLYYTTDAIGTGEAVVGSIGVDGDVTWSRQLGNRRTTAPIIFDGQLILGAIMKPRALPGTESYTSASVEIIAYT